jgi:hypothetical protein
MNHHHEKPEDPSMGGHSLAIPADRPEVGPCLQAFFRQALMDDADKIRNLIPHER